MTMTEWEIRMSQAGIEPEEPIERYEPLPRWASGVFWYTAIIIGLTIVGGGAYWAWGALE